MRTIVKVLGIAAAALAVLFGVAALLLWVVFDPDNVREELEAFVAERTGREFYIDDDLALTLFPWLGIETGAMLLGHAAGFGDGDFASVDSAVARVRLLPLFRGRMEFGAVVLDGLELNLARDADGRDNWSDLLGPPSADGTDGALTSSEATPDALGSAIDEPFFSDVDIAGIEVRNGIVFWRENIDEVRYVISDISLGTGPITAGMPVDIDAGLQWVSVQPAFTAQLDGRTSLVMNPDAAGYRADGLRLQFRVEDGQSDERIAGNLQTSAVFDNASRIISLDNLQLESVLTDFTASTEPVDVTAVAPSLSVDTAAWTADVPEAVTTIGGIAARWHVTAANLAAEPLFAGTVVIAESPADEVLALLGVEHEASLGDFDLESEIRLEPLAGRVALTGLTGSLLEMAVTGDFALGDTDISGNLEAPTFDPGVLFSVLPPEWLAGANVTGIEQLALSAELHRKPESTTASPCANLPWRRPARPLRATWNGRATATASTDVSSPPAWTRKCWSLSSRASCPARSARSVSGPWGSTPRSTTTARDPYSAWMIFPPAHLACSRAVTSPFAIPRAAPTSPERCKWRLSPRAHSWNALAGTCRPPPIRKHCARRP